MGYPTIAASTNEMTLDATIARLAAHPAVAGLLLMGTTGTDALTPASDYDLLLILDQPDASLGMVQTWIDGRLTEIYCTPQAALARIVDDSASWSDRSEEGAIVRWLRDGRIVHDRENRLRQAQERVRATPPPRQANDAQIYAAWRSIGYNVAQSRRYLASDDPVAWEAVDWRLLHGIAEIHNHFFTVRRLPWRGEKPAIRYLAEHDPAFLALQRRCLAEPDRRRKFALYEDLARHALAPVGDLWQPGTTVVSPGPGFGATGDTAASGTVGSALALWQALLGE
jgi:hypothetical protein